MRGQGVAIAVAGSALLHVALLAVLDEVDGPALVGPLADRRPLLTLEPLPPPVEDTTPIDVVLLPPPATEPPPAIQAPPATEPPPATAAAAAPAAPPASPARAPAEGATDAPAIAATTADPLGAVRPGEPGMPGEPGVPAPGALSMRNPRSLAPRLNLWKVPLTVAPPDPSRPAYVPPEPTGHLRPDGAGTFRTDRPGFTGHVAADGTVSFEDKPSAHVRLNIPRPTKLARAAGRGLEDWYEGGGPILPRTDLAPDGSRLAAAVEDEDPDHSRPPAVIAPIITGGFDATDAVMRRAGMDPYAAAKLRWLDETRAERMAMREAHRRRELARSTQSMRRHLARLWQRPGLDDATRRALLFELWDDCVETGDDAVLAACERTRAAVVAFIRAKLPAGSAAAYSPAELRALNARRVSSIAFAPY